MLLFLLKRLMWLIPLFFLLAFLCFGLVEMMPGDFYTKFLLSGNPEMVEAMRAMRGLDKPWYMQFVFWLEGVILHGDLGVSLMTWGPASRLIWGQGGALRWTLIIAGSSWFLACLFGVLVGVLVAVRKNSWIDHVFTIATYAGISLPSYVFAWIFLLFFFKVINPLLYGPGTWGLLDLHYLRAPMSWAKVGNYLWHLWPGWLVIGAPVFATIVRNLRLALYETFHEQYITTAYGKGLPKSKIVFKHALRNALNPLLSLWGITFPMLITGLMLTASVFHYPTLAPVFLNAIRQQDTFVVIASVFFYTLFVLGGNFVGDILLVFVDPRIRYG